jgi:hypothetical protein
MQLMGYLREAKQERRPVDMSRNDIFPGQWVHVHNVAGQRGRGDLAGG